MKRRRVCRQTKRQLVPTDDWASPGHDMLVFRVAGTPCCAIICHDIRHPELVRLPVLQGARVVFYCSWETSANDDYISLDDTEELAVYRAQVQARAVENGVWIVHANAAANLEDQPWLSWDEQNCQPERTCCSRSITRGRDVTNTSA